MESIKVPSQESQHRAVKKKAKKRFTIEDLFTHTEEEVAAALNCKATQVNREDISEELAKKETESVQRDEIPHKPRKGRKMVDFIGEKEFNRLACQQPIP